MEYVGEAPPGANNAVVNRNENKVYTMAWEIYGIRGIYLVFEPSDSRPEAEKKGRSIPTTGTGPVSFKASDFENGCYRITLRIDTNTGKRTDFGEKFFCVTG